MKALHASETSGTTHPTTRRHVTQDLHLQQQRCVFNTFSVLNIEPIRPASADSLYVLLSIDLLWFRIHLCGTRCHVHAARKDVVYVGGLGGWICACALPRYSTLMSHCRIYVCTLSPVMQVSKVIFCWSSPRPAWSALTKARGVCVILVRTKESKMKDIWRSVRCMLRLLHLLCFCCCLSPSHKIC
jgi:hypothetical protein